MRFIRVIFLVIIILLIELYGKLIVNEWELSKNKPEVKQYEKVEKKKPPVAVDKNSLVKMIEMNESALVKKLGEPNRIDPSDYGYEWWVYNDLDTYMQFGIKDNKVVTIYSAGNEVDISPFKIGQRYEELYRQQVPLEKVAFNYKDESYEFMLTEEDLFERPLIKVENAWVQLYFDKFTHTLSSLRVMDDETLLRQRPYELAYTGNLPYSSVQITIEKKEAIEKANAKQIFDLTNVIRKKNDLPLLKWNDKVATMAYEHSKDMSINQYFDHVSLSKEDLKGRLTRNDIQYRMAGENIAKQYVDGVAALEGWMNSQAHRVNILNNEFNSLGVGVYEKYYTQNFVKN
ncbi:MAG: CAP domain-containing protein [Bacillaceae bacterium]